MTEYNHGDRVRFKNDYSDIEYVGEIITVFRSENNPHMSTDRYEIEIEIEECLDVSPEEHDIPEIGTTDLILEKL